VRLRATKDALTVNWFSVENPELPRASGFMTT
jgi:hypothetical protein